MSGKVLKLFFMSPSQNWSCTVRRMTGPLPGIPSWPIRDLKVQGMGADNFNCPVPCRPFSPAAGFSYRYAQLRPRTEPCSGGNPPLLVAGRFFGDLAIKTVGLEPDKLKNHSQSMTLIADTIKAMDKHTSGCGTMRNRKHGYTNGTSKLATLRILSSRLNLAMLENRLFFVHECDVWKPRVAAWIQWPSF